MATTKKTKATEPKTFTLTEEQWNKIKDINDRLSTIRYNLLDIEGKKNISAIMFNVGNAYNAVSLCEDELTNITDQFEEESDDELEW
jgi:hypothetical protein